jgi:hypothetical protein
LGGAAPATVQPYPPRPITLAMPLAALATAWCGQRRYAANRPKRTSA